jgi:hypothetical protein
MKTNWSVLSFYEDGEARQLAVQFCDGLVQRFWSESAFDLSWCDWAGLAHPLSANEAGKKALQADLIVVALNASGTIPLAARNWLERAVQNRGAREGVLVGLPGADPGCDAKTAATQMYLRKLAHQAGMDFLTAVPQSLPVRVPDSTDAYNQRASQVTSVLDKILNYTALPPQLL